MLVSDVGKTVSKNFAILFIRQLFTWASTFLLLMFLPKHLGPVNFGKYYLGQSLTMIFMVLIDFGGNLWITKEVSRNRERTGQIIVNALALRGLLWLFSFCAINIYAYIAGYDSSTCIIIAIFGLGMIWNGANGVILSCYQGYELMKYSAYSGIVSSAFISIVGVATLIGGIGPIGFTVITVLGNLLAFGVCAAFVPRMTTDFPRVNWRSAFEQLKQGIPYFLNTIFSTIYYRIATVMLSLMTPKTVMGWYGASYRFFDSLMFLPSLLSVAVFPAMSRLWGEGNSVTKSFQKGLDFLFLVGIPISIGVFVFSNEIIALFYGLEGYGRSVLLLQIFACGMMLVYIDIMLGTTLLASDKQRHLSVISLLSIFVNVGLNFLLIPMTQKSSGNGSIGSALATLITELFVMSSMLMLLRKSILKESKITVQLKVIAAGFLMAGTLELLNVMGIHWIIQAILGSGVYLGAVIILKTVERSDIELLKAAIPKRIFQSSIISNKDTKLL